MHLVGRVHAYVLGRHQWLHGAERCDAPCSEPLSVCCSATKCWCFVRFVKYLPNEPKRQSTIRQVGQIHTMVLSISSPSAPLRLCYKHFWPWPVDLQPGSAYLRHFLSFGGCSPEHAVERAIFSCVTQLLQAARRRTFLTLERAQLDLSLHIQLLMHRRGIPCHGTHSITRISCSTSLGPATRVSRQRAQLLLDGTSLPQRVQLPTGNLHKSRNSNRPL